MASAGSVLIIDENLPVPFDRRVWMEARALRAAGYDVVVICPQTDAYPLRQETLEGIEVLRHPLSLEADSPKGYLREYAEALFWEGRLAVATHRRRPVDVVQVCNPPDLLFLSGGLLKLLHGAALVFDHHDINPELYEAKYGRRDAFYRGLILAERATFAAADVVMSTNESYRSIAATRGRKRAEDVFVVRNGPDLSRFVEVTPHESFKRGREYLVGYVGTMGEQEGIDHLLRAARRVTRDLRRQDVAFCIIGGGPALDGLRVLSHEMGLADVVEFSGRVSDEELLARLSTCDVCVNPDPKTPFNDASTMTKIMDYMALRKPVVQFDLVEGRRSAEQASLYAINDEDFADKIIELLDDAELRQRMGAIGRERMETMLDWRLQVPHLLAAYERAMDVARRRRERRRSVASHWAAVRSRG